MEDRLTTMADVEIAGILHFAEDKSTVRKVVSKMLNGQPAIQTIGTAMKTFSIAFHAIKDGRDVLNNICATGASFKLYYHDKVYRGIIEDESISWSFVLRTKGRDWATGTFTFIVQEVLV